MEEINIYCDESNHLKHNSSNIMTLGYVSCPINKARHYNKLIREIKEKNNLNKNYEIKWIKVSKSKIDFYKELIDMFFKDKDLKFRCIIADKEAIDYVKYHLTHDQWYYRMYYLLLGKSLRENNTYNIYVDEKDTCSNDKVKRLRSVLTNSYYDYALSMINKIQQVKSKDIELLQLNDLFIGAIGYYNNNLSSSNAKLEVIDIIKSNLNYDLKTSTSLSEEKFNLFVWGNNS